MKSKLFSILLVIVILLLNVVVAYSDSEFEGEGTEESPYIISNSDDLIRLSELSNVAATADYATKYYKLTDDIDLSGNSFKPISYGTSMYTKEASTFTGTFDGNGHIIKNLTMTEAISAYGATYGVIGLLGSKGVIKNLGVENVMINGGNAERLCIGGIVGSIFNEVSIDNCYVNGMSVSATSTTQNIYVAGIAGRTISQTGTITNCYSTNLNYSLVAKGDNKAGILGSCGANGYSAENCYTTYALIQGNVSATNSYMSVSNCYTVVEPTDVMASDLGSAFKENQTVKNDGFPILQWESTEGYDDIGDIETFDPYFSGKGTEDEPFLIQSASDLTQLASLTNSDETAAKYAAIGIYYKLTDNIDMSYESSYIPISRATNMYQSVAAGGAFKGTLDGDGHVIKNVIMNSAVMNTYGNTYGIVGYLGANGCIKNLGVENLIVENASANRLCIGGIVGSVNAPVLIDNCYVRGMTVTATSSEPTYVGGIAGRTISNAGNITNCYSAGLVYSLTNANFSGGILGSCGNANYASKNCYTTHKKIQGDASATGAFMAANNCYSDESVKNLTPETLGEAFIADDALLNSGMPVLAWEYDSQHSETACFDITVHGEAVTDGKENVAANYNAVLEFDREMNSDTLDRIVVLKNGESVENVTFKVSGNDVIISPALEYGTRYQIFVPKTVQSVKDADGRSAKAEEKEITFTTEAALSVKDVKLNGKPLSEATINRGDDIIAAVNIRNLNASNSQDAAVILALYDKNGVMKYAALDTAKIAKSGEDELSVTLHIPDDIEDGFSIAVMVWDSINDMNAVCRAYIH